MKDKHLSAGTDGEPNMFARWDCVSVVVGPTDGAAPRSWPNDAGPSPVPDLAQTCGAGPSTGGGPGGAAAGRQALAAARPTVRSRAETKTDEDDQHMATATAGGAATAMRHQEPAHGTIDVFLRELLREVMREEVRTALAEEREQRPRAVPETGYLTVEESAAHARVDEATIRAWIRRGHLGTYRAGRVYRVAKHELETYLSRQGAPAPTMDLRARARAFLAKRASRR